MENASKALLIAGGILIALLIIALLVYSFGSMSGYFSSEETKEEAEQLEAFNKQYEAYQRKLLRGTDVVSVINKVLDNNDKYGPDGYNEPNYIIEVKIEINETVGNLVAGNTYSIAEYIRMKQDKSNFDDFKRKIFDCKEIKYHSTTGRVNYISFTERKVTYGEGL